jgi:hypothetical protein
MSNTSLFPVSPLESVREGMTVVDEHRHRLGTVGYVQLGYPSAVEADKAPPEGLHVGVVVAPLQASGGTTAFGAAMPFFGHGLDDPELPDEFREELLRAGFIRVDGSTLHGPLRFVAGDHILEVSGDTVRVALNAAPSESPRRDE